MQKLGAKPKLAWFGTSLFIFSPATFWWSFLPVTIAGFAIAGSYLVTVAAERWEQSRRLSAVLYAAGGGILLARLVTGYIPWALTIGVPIVLATSVWLVWPKAERRFGLLALAAGSLTSVSVLVLMVWENLPGIKAQLATVYPGQRITTGRALDPGELFGAPVLFKLQSSGTVLVGTNASEISTGFTIALVLAVAMIAMSPNLGRDRDSAAMITLAACCLAWFSWVVVHWGTIGSKIPAANLVDPLRVAQSLGFPAILLLSLVLSRWAAPVGKALPVLIAASCALITAYGGGVTQQTRMPGLRGFEVGLAAFAIGAVVYFMVAHPHRRWPFIIPVLLAASAVAFVNPITIGLGDLRASASAQRMLEEGKKARAANELWATDLWFDDALLDATGTPILGGNQMSGPNREQWLKLDPTAQHEFVWNRGASIIKFAWTVGPDIIIESPQPDVITVTVDPCTLQGRGFNVTYVVSTQPLQGSCLVPEQSLQWFSQNQFVYAVQK
ncbi:hypothetical protein EH165_10650 [Nakamurella antarctica]|uniref:Uncharacterized protein n=1 Tax=Nakamurella antarctica TaxID=1902245 RepID=A0A3G8ZMZ7_9ACTN|nr:hypothetical protein [Nakamurella antarctica]AZI58518.1 hypothetical protein EH165_10650 [Nakamurella antarctica]